MALKLLTKDLESNYEAKFAAKNQSAVNYDSSTATGYKVASTVHTRAEPRNHRSALFKPATGRYQ